MDVRVLLSSLLLIASPLSVALQDLSDEEMLEVSGEGIGLVYEDYQFNAEGSVLGGSSSDLTFKITGITESDGSAVDVGLSHMYIAGPGTNLGTDLDGRVVNLGRLGNPYEIDMLDGNTLDANPMGWTDKAVFSMSAPKQLTDGSGYDCTSASAAVGSGNCTSRPETGTFGDAGYYHGERADIGIRLNLDYDGAGTTRDTNLNIHGQSVHFDGSYLRIWGGNADVDADGNDDETMMMEAQINVYADKLIMNSCDFDGANCGNNITYDQFKLELALGDAKYYQPMTFDVDANGHFNITIQPVPTPGDARVDSSIPPASEWNTGTVGSYGGGHLVPGNPSGAPDDGTDPATYNWYLDYYENGRKTNFSVDNMTVGGENFGASRITNMQIQYLEVTSHDL